MAKVATKDELGLSCREAQLLLSVMPVREKFTKMRPVERAAFKHYLHCHLCRGLGLAKILDRELSCQEALLVWAKNPGALWLHLQSVEILIEECAVEHVWGKFRVEETEGIRGYDQSAACQQSPCRALWSYWQNVPMSSMAGDGADGVIGELPFLLRIFQENDFSLEPLFKIQKERMAELLENLKKGKITISPGHYHSMPELVGEVQANVEALQQLALDLANPPLVL